MKNFYQIILITLALLISSHLFNFMLILTGNITFNNPIYYDVFRYLNFWLSLVILVTFIIYFHKMNFKVVRNVYIIYFLISMTIAFYITVKSSYSFDRSDFKARLIKLETCAELAFYLSILFTQAKEYIYLKAYAIAMLLITIVFQGLVLFDITEGYIYRAFLISIAEILLIFHFMRHMKFSQNEKSDILDESEYE